MFNSSMKMWNPMAASQMHSSLVFLRLSWSWRLTLTSGLSQQTNIAEAKEIEVGDRYDHLGSRSSTRIFPGDPVQLTVSKAPAEERTIKSSEQPRKCGNTKDSSPETKLKVVKGSDLRNSFKFQTQRQQGLSLQLSVEEFMRFLSPFI